MGGGLINISHLTSKPINTIKDQTKRFVFTPTINKYSNCTPCRYAFD